MTRTARAASITCGCAMFFAASGCTLMALDDLDLETCDPLVVDKNPCQVLDRRDHVPESACEHWQCRKDGPGCELRPKDYDDDGQADARVCTGPGATDCDDANVARKRGKPELCDGIDNDCDGIIDARALDHHFSEARDLQLSSQGTPIEVGLVQGETEAPLLAVTHAGFASVLDMRQQTQRGAHYTSAIADGAKNCPTPSGPAGCNFKQLALAATPTRMLSASVSDNAGCPRGELRLGVANPTEGDLSIWLGGPRPDVESNVQYGVGVGEESRCPSLGAHSPALAGLDARGIVQGVAAWIEAERESGDACAAETEVASVRALGGWAMGGRSPFVQASDQGRPQTIGETRTTSAAALLAWRREDRNAGYLLAFGNAASGLEARAIEQLPLPDIETVTPPLQLSDPLLFPQAGPVDLVSMALAPWSDGSRLRFAAVFRVGCADQRHLAFITFELVNEPLHARVEQVHSAVVAPAPVRSSLSARPSVVHLASGFLEDAAHDETRGGWLVSWLEREASESALKAMRFSEAGEPLDREPFVITSGGFDAFVAYSVDGRRASYTLVNQNTRTLTTGTALCSAP